MLSSAQTSDTAPKCLSGAQMVVEALHREGVEHVFGYPGGAVLPLYDAFYRQTYFKHILVRHEQAALHMADAYARSTGKVGVAVVTSGPGATNAVTGIATAYADSVPLVVFSGQVATPLIGSDAFQECDTVGITRPCVKHNYLVKKIEDLPRILKEAFYIARSGRPGPVLVDLPKDIQDAKAPFEYPETIDIVSYRPVVKGHPGQIKRALQLLLAAKKPLFYVGGGTVLADGAQAMNELAAMFNYPVVTTLTGIGGFDGTSPLSLGMVGMHGTYEANMAMQECDVLFAVGARFDDRVIGNPSDFERPSRTIIQVDVDPSSISKNVQTDVPIVGDVREVLSEMVRLLKESGDRPDPAATAQWVKDITLWRSKKCLAYKTKKTGPIQPQAVIERVAEAAGNDAYFSTDVGEHQMWAAQYLKFKKPRHWCTSGGLGTMGYGFPAALGVQVAHPEAQSVLFTGDGSIQMNIQELATAKQYGLKPKIFLLNNGYLGMVAFWQRTFYEGHLSESVMDVQPDFVKLVESYGHVGLRAATYGELNKCIKDAFGRYKDELVFIDVHIAPEEPVLPMVGPGRGLTAIVLPEGAGK